MSIDFNTKRTWGPKPNYPLVEKYKRPNKDFIFVAGPCSVESHNQINNLAVIAGMHGATHLRGGVYRAGTYPPDIKGLIAHELIESYMHASEVNDLQNIIEVIDLTEIEYLNGYSHCFQVGARQMQNYGLLRQFSNYPGTVFLKRNPGATIDEWLGSAEYLLQGNCDVVLVERGSVTHMNHVRYDLSISAIAAVKRITDIPVIVDASHGTGRRDLVEPMTLAGLAAGADGCLIEFHQDPDKSISDSEQALSIEQFQRLAEKVNKYR